MIATKGFDGAAGIFKVDARRIARIMRLLVFSTKTVVEKMPKNV